MHFPIALLSVGAVLDVMGAVSRNEQLRRGAGVLLILGAASALAAFFTGQGAIPQALPRLVPEDPRLEAHTQWAAGGLWITVVAGVLRILWRNRLSGPYGWATLLAGALSALLILFVGLSGSAISHGG